MHGRKFSPMRSISVVIGHGVTAPESHGTQPQPPVVAVPTRMTLYYTDNPEPTDHLTAAVEQGRISVRAARRMGWTR